MFYVTREGDRCLHRGWAKIAWVSGLPKGRGHGVERGGRPDTKVFTGLCWTSGFWTFKLIGWNTKAFCLTLREMTANWIWSNVTSYYILDLGRGLGKLYVIKRSKRRDQIFMPVRWIQWKIDRELCRGSCFGRRARATSASFTDNNNWTANNPGSFILATVRRHAVVTVRRLKLIWRHQQQQGLLHSAKRNESQQQRMRKVCACSCTGNSKDTKAWNGACGCGASKTFFCRIQPNLFYFYFSG